HRRSGSHATSDFFGYFKISECSDDYGLEAILSGQAIGGFGKAFGGPALRAAVCCARTQGENGARISSYASLSQDQPRAVALIAADMKLRLKSVHFDASRACQFPLHL